MLNKNDMVINVTMKINGINIVINLRTRLLLEIMTRITPIPIKIIPRVINQNVK